MKYYLFFQNIRTNISILFILALLNASGLAPIQAQSANNQLKLAKTLERNHDYENAYKLYQEIYKKDIRNMAAIAGIKNCLIGLQQYEKLVSFLESIIEQQQSQANWYVDLAEAYYLNNEKEKAFSLWNNYLESNKNDPSAYRLAAGTMIRQRLFEQAIAVYMGAVKNLKNQEVLHLDIANLYRALLDYERACEHYLMYYAYFPKQYTYIQNQILILSSKTIDNTPVINALLAFLNKDPEQIKIKEILAGIYMKDKNYTAAFDVYKGLETDKSEGVHLYKYATEAYSNHAYSHAIEGFEYLIQSIANSPLLPQAKYELGRSYMSLALAADRNEEAARNIQIAINIFETERTSNRNPYYALNSIISLGDIYFEYYFDLDNAIFYYKMYLDLAAAGILRDEILIKLGDVYLTKNQLNEAFKSYVQVAQNKLKTKARFKVAEISFFKHKFQDAIQQLQDLSTEIPSDDPLLNDILDRSLLLTSSVNDSLSMTKFADAELLRFQRKLTEAAELYSDISKGKSGLQSISGLYSATLYMKLRNFEEAKEVLLSLKNNLPDDKNRDEILYLLAGCEEGQNNFKSAVNIYHELMISYPTSLFVQSARERARVLNEKLLQEQI